MDPAKLLKAEPTVISRLNPQTLEQYYYPGLKVGREELAIQSTETSKPLQAPSYKLAMTIATQKVTEMKERIRKDDRASP